MYSEKCTQPIARFGVQRAEEKSMPLCDHDRSIRAFQRARWIGRMPLQRSQSYWFAKPGHWWTGVIACCWFPSSQTFWAT